MSGVEQKVSHSMGDGPSESARPLSLRRRALKILRRFPLPFLFSNYGLQKEMVRTGLFDSDFYRRSYPDIEGSNLSPLSHYLHFGWREGRDPSERFSVEGYLKRYPDVAESDVEPLTHYVRRGRGENRAMVSRDGQVLRLSPVPSLRQRVSGLVALLRQRPDLVRKFIDEMKRGGVRHALRLTRRKLGGEGGGLTPQAERSLRDMVLAERLRVIPAYTNPHLQKLPVLQKRSLAVHVHLFYPDMTDACVEYLRNIPVAFDLFISVSKGVDRSETEATFRGGLSRCERILVEAVPNRGRDLAPLIIQFGRRLAAYDYIAHFHTKKSPHLESLRTWFDGLMRTLCGSINEVTQILHLLDTDGSVIFPVGNTRVYDDESGWGANYGIAQTFLKRYSTIRIEDFPFVEFPQGGMFWAKAEAVKEFLSLPLSFADFPAEPIEPDGTLAHVLERLVLLFSSRHKGRNYQLASPALSPGCQDYYEEQIDVSGRVRHESVKVLAYYLPQFHPTPENDEWHGEGFTEWYKVRGGTPLFEGHYQQHIPHPDLGYYHLGSTEVLKKQATMMRRAGVHGLVFYHYWFSGRLILEKPAQMLLADQTVDLPFCFCWANENWTRRWDGNEREILLEQVYSRDDAAAFIRYLIPFFRDKRYITIEGRPVLFVYRPASIVGSEEYLSIWRRECESAGLPPPFVVATLTRGAATPNAYGMDAAVERPLHDWTGGAVPELKGSLRHYWPVAGSVLDYSAVADFYIGKESPPEFTLFRSLVPVWDNTARYGSEAYLLHDFSPRKMQEWAESLIRYSEEHLPADRRFVVVNAWNEWAEGAHLEPDIRHGYAYLNSIGRALAAIPFDGIVEEESRSHATLHIMLAPDMLATMRRCEETRRAFSHCLRASVRDGTIRLVSPDRDIVDVLDDRGLTVHFSEEPVSDFILVFEKPMLFPSGTLKALLGMARRHRGFVVSAQPLNSPAHVFEGSVNYSIRHLQRGGLELRPHGAILGRKLCGDAACFHLGPAERLRTGGAVHRVSTIIRIHRNGDHRLLVNALYSLLAQPDCIVQPWLALQDFSDADVANLEASLAHIPVHTGGEIVIRRFFSTAEIPDRRSQMLNESLREIGSGFVSMLDYDDVLFPGALARLASRLLGTGKNATFGRVFSTAIDHVTNVVVRRDRVYDWGYTWEDFFRLNMAPIHSFLLNLDRFDVSSIEYDTGMRFLEDYYLTLQIFTPGETDWQSLKHDFFIGDYVTRRGSRSQTLAHGCPAEREQVLSSNEYRLCEARVRELKERIVAQRANRPPNGVRAA